MYRLDGAMDPPMIRVDDVFLLKLWLVAAVVVFRTLPLLRREDVGEVLGTTDTTTAARKNNTLAVARKRKMWCIIIGIHYEQHMQCNDDCILSRCIHEGVA